MNLLHLYRVHLTRRFSENTVRLRAGYADRMGAEIDLRRATTETLERYLDAHPEWMPATRSAVVQTMRSFYGWAARQGHIMVDPSRDVPLPRIPRTRARIADEGVLLTAFDAASPRDQAILLLGAECGLRVSEIAALHVDQREGHWLHIVGKGGVYRPLYMTDELAGLLDVLAETARDGWYFPSREGGHLSQSSIYRRVRITAGYNTHALRHRAGTATYRNTGNDLRLAQEFLGHGSPTTTAIYVHIEPDDLRRAAAATSLQRARQARAA